MEVKRKHLCEEGERLQKQADLYQNITYAGVGLTAMGFAPLSGPAIATTATGSSVLASMPAIGSASLSQIATGLTYAAGATEVLYAGSNIMELETGNNPIKETFYGGDDEDDAAFEKDLEILNKINIASTLVGAASAVSSGISNAQGTKSQGTSGGSGKNFKSQTHLKSHYDDHGKQIANALEKTDYTIDDYLNDASYIIDKGEYVPELNGYVKFMSGDKFGFVGLDQATGDITTFHIKTVSELIKKAPSLGLGK